MEAESLTVPNSVAPTLLCIDDEVNVLRALKRLLRSAPFKVLTATNSTEAFAIMEKEVIQVVIADQRMPEMNGTALLQKIKDKYPSTVRVILSGYSDVSAILETINRGEVYRFIGKPWDDQELKTTINQCFEHYALINQNVQLLRQLQQQNQTLEELNQHLQDTIQQRTQTLALTQNILEGLPLPLLCISAEEIVVKANISALECLQKTALGEKIDGLFSSQVEQQLKRLLIGTITDNTTIFCEKINHLLQIIPLKHNNNIQGCLLIIKEQDT